MNKAFFGLVDEFTASVTDTYTPSVKLLDDGVLVFKYDGYFLELPSLVWSKCSLSWALKDRVAKAIAKNPDRVPTDTKGFKKSTVKKHDQLLWDVMDISIPKKLVDSLSVNKKLTKKLDKRNGSKTADKLAGV